MTNKFLIIVTLIGISGLKLNACICTMPPYEEEVQFVDEIFLGNVHKAERFVVTKRKDKFDNEEIFWGWRYYFTVKKKWKGNSQNEFIVEYYGSSCDLSFALNSEDILVYANSTSKMKMLSECDKETKKGIELIRISSCSRTIPKSGKRKENWYTADLFRINTEFPTAGVQINNTENSREELYKLYLFGNKWLRFMGILIIFLSSLNIFQFYRNKRKTVNKV